MISSMAPESRPATISAPILLALVIGAVYSNTLDVPWHLDDLANILENPSVRINGLDAQSLMKPIQDSLAGGRFDRPLARLTFALNWYFGKDSPQGYHVVNIVVHISTAFLLLLTARALFLTPRLRNVPRGDADFVSFLGAVLWAANPIQTQAVTYIVQRMAAMAALFYIAGLYLYVAGRLSNDRRRQLAYFAFCALSFLMGMASKENAILLPISLFLVEVTFLQDALNRKTLFRIGGVALACGALVVTFGALLFVGGQLETVLNYGDARSFSPLERLMTQPRVILLYLSQIFYPVPTRLSIEHDVAVSTSLLHPWTTLPSLLLIAAMNVYAVIRVRKQPLLSFGILFFFANHLIESTVVGLELVFEHRNYLPSMFLFFPLAAGLKWLLNYYRRSSRAMAAVVAAFTTLLVVGFGTGTYIRNQAWASPRSLWEDAARKAPLSSRPLHNLAWNHYEAVGDYGTALKLYQKALTLNLANTYQEPVLLKNIAALHYLRGNYAGAAEYLAKAIEVRPNYIAAIHLLSLTLLRSGHLQEAQAAVEKILGVMPDYAKALNLNGIIMLQRQRFPEAVASFKRAMRSPATAAAATLNLGTAYLRSGNLKKAEMYYRMSLSRFPAEKVGLLWLAVLESESVDPEAQRVWMKRLLSTLTIPEIGAMMSKDAEGLQLYHDSFVLPTRTPAFTAALAAEAHPAVLGSPGVFRQRRIAADD